MLWSVHESWVLNGTVCSKSTHIVALNLFLAFLHSFFMLCHHSCTYSLSLEPFFLSKTITAVSIPLPHAAAVWDADLRMRRAERKVSGRWKLCSIRGSNGRSHMMVCCCRHCGVTSVGPFSFSLHANSPCQHNCWRDLTNAAQNKQVCELRHKISLQLRVSKVCATPILVLFATMIWSLQATTAVDTHFFSKTAPLGSEDWQCWNIRGDVLI